MTKRELFKAKVEMMSRLVPEGQAKIWQELNIAANEAIDEVHWEGWQTILSVLDGKEIFLDMHGKTYQLTYLVIPQPQKDKHRIFIR